MKLSEYKTIIFDCDGVVLDSNRVKTHAFYLAALCYGEAAAQALVEHHTANGGISRFRKFEYFLNEIVDVRSDESDMQYLLDAYSKEVADGLMQCQIAEGLEDLRRASPNAKWLIVSGGAQVELRHVFSERGISDYFDGGIFGSPDPKDTIFAREIAADNIEFPALFIGDSRYDHTVSEMFKTDFVFVSAWAEFKGWQDYFANTGVTCKSALSDLIAQ